MHQATKEYEIEVSDSTDFNPSIDVFVAKGDKMSIQVPKSSKYHKVKRIQEADFLQYFNQTLYKLDQLDTCGGEYYIDTEDYSEDYELQAFLEEPHINIKLSISHSADMCDCRMSISHSFTYRPGVRRKYTTLPESTFRQVYNLMLERRKSIELRLVSVDEPPQKRRELRAEMKGIDFCISVLDANR